MKLPCALCLLVALLAACEKPAETSNPEAQTVEIEDALALSVQVPRLLTLVGTLAAQERVIISPEVGGTVSELSIDFGDAVESDDLLLRLNPDELELLADAARASVAQTKAVLEQTRSAYHRSRQLQDQKIVSEDELEKALSQLRVAEANHNAAAKQLAIAEDHVGDTFLRAPLSGFVAARHVSVGQYVSPYTPVLELVAVDPLRLRLEVPERSVGAIREGMSVTVVLVAFPGEEFSGQVTRLGAALDPDTRTLLVEAAIANPDGRLKPGQFAHTTLDLGMEEATVVPRAAVDTFAGTHRAFVIGPTGHVDARSVTPGRDLGETMEILEGIEPGERVATSHLDRLADGLQVNVASRNSP